MAGALVRVMLFVVARNFKPCLMAKLVCALSADVLILFLCMGCTIDRCELPCRPVRLIVLLLMVILLLRHPWVSPHRLLVSLSGLGRRCLVLSRDRRVVIRLPRVLILVPCRGVVQKFRIRCRTVWPVLEVCSVGPLVGVGLLVGPSLLLSSENEPLLSATTCSRRRLLSWSRLVVPCPLLMAVRVPLLGIDAPTFVVFLRGPMGVGWNTNYSIMRKTYLRTVVKSSIPCPCRCLNLVEGLSYGPPPLATTAHGPRRNNLGRLTLNLDFTLVVNRS